MVGGDSIIHLDSYGEPRTAKAKQQVQLDDKNSAVV